MSNDQGGIVTGWLFRLLLFFVLMGLGLFEAGAVVVARVGVDGTADTAARDAAGIYGTTHNVDTARAEADKDARTGGARLVDFSVSKDGKTVTVVLERTASTFVIQHISPLKKYRVTRSTHDAPVT